MCLILFYATNKRNSSEMTEVHGSFGQSQGCTGADFSMLLCFWHPLLEWHKSLMSLSILGHHTFDLAIDFILTMPKCPSWRSYKTLTLSFSGIIVRFPHIKQFRWQESAWHTLLYGQNRSAPSGKALCPLDTLFRTCEKITSLWVSSLTCVLETDPYEFCRIL